MAKYMFASKEKESLTKWKTEHMLIWTCVFMFYVLFMKCIILVKQCRYLDRC